MSELSQDCSHHINTPLLFADDVGSSAMKVILARHVSQLAQRVHLRSPGSAHIHINPSALLTLVVLS